MEDGYVEYVVRQHAARKWWVYMIELAPDGKTVTGSHQVSGHRLLAAADKAAASLRSRDEAHVSRRAA